MDFSAFKEWVFLGVVSSGVYILWQMKENMSQMNAKLEVLIVRHESAEQKIDDHETRLRKGGL